MPPSSSCTKRRPLPGSGAAHGLGRARRLRARRPCPHSDIDLLLLHDGEEPAAVAALTEQLLYPLWDAGFSVGHAVRTPGESAELATERLDAATAILDARLLAGDAALLAGVSDPCWPASRDVDAFARSGWRRRPRTARSVRFGVVPVGTRAEGGRRRPPGHPRVRLAPGGAGPAFEDDGLLRPTERDQLEAAEEFLTRVSSALHLDSGAPPTAASRAATRDRGSDGLSGRARLIAVDGLMRAVFEHARAVDALTEDVIVRGRRSGGPSGHRRVRRPGGSALARRSGGQRGPTTLCGRAGHRRSRSEPGTSTGPPQSATRSCGSSVRGRGRTDGLQALDRTGLLVRLIPEWVDVRCRPQRDPYHRYTVDVHLLRAFDADVADVGASPTRTTRWRSWRPLKSRNATARCSARSCTTSARTARAVTCWWATGSRHGPRAHGCRGSTGELARFMVAEHLLLPDTATGGTSATTT